MLYSPLQTKNLGQSAQLRIRRETKKSKIASEHAVNLMPVNRNGLYFYPFQFLSTHVTIEMPWTFTHISIYFPIVMSFQDEKHFFLFLFHGMEGLSKVLEGTSCGDQNFIRRSFVRKNAALMSALCKHQRQTKSDKN